MPYHHALISFHFISFRIHFPCCFFHVAFHYFLSHVASISCHLPLILQSFPFMLRHYVSYTSLKGDMLKPVRGVSAQTLMLFFIFRYSDFRFRFAIILEACACCQIRVHEHAHVYCISSLSSFALIVFWVGNALVRSVKGQTREKCKARVSCSVPYEHTWAIKICAFS